MKEWQILLSPLCSYVAITLVAPLTLISTLLASLINYIFKISHKSDHFSPPPAPPSELLWSSLSIVFCSILSGLLFALAYSFQNNLNKM